MPFAGTQAAVQWYDEVSNEWVAIEDAVIADGYLSFSAQTLSRFKIPTLQDDGGTVSEDAPYEGRDQSCFLQTARSDTNSTSPAWILSGIILICALLRGFEYRSNHPGPWPISV